VLPIALLLLVGHQQGHPACEKKPAPIVSKGSVWGTVSGTGFYVPLNKIGHFGDVSQANLLPWYGKTKPNTTKAHIHQSK